MFVVVVGLFRMERSGGLYVIPNILLSFMFIFNTSLLRKQGVLANHDRDGNGNVTKQKV